jgi:hypothetical protein
MTMGNFRSVLLLLAGLILAQACAVAADSQLTSDVFNIQYGAGGITSIKRVKDVYDTEYITPGGALGSMVIRFRTPGETNWRTASEIKMTGQPASGSNAVDYMIGVLEPTIAALSTKSASSNNAAAALDALSDGRVPPPGAAGRGARGTTAGGRGGAGAVPSFTWQGERGSTQWVQYSLPKVMEVSTIQVYWNLAVTTDPATSIKAPESWRLLYRDGQDWKEVRPGTPYSAQPDAFTIVSFAPVTTTALRIEAKLAADATAGIYEWRIGADDHIVAPVKELATTSSFKLDDRVLNWTLTLRNQTGQPLEIGDLAVPLNFAERTPQGRGEIYTQKLIRHSLIAGNGSWIYWQRSNAEGPFLVMVPQGKSKFEYFGNPGLGGGVGVGFTPFIHSTVSSAVQIATGGNWRLPITNLKLDPTGAPGDSVTYSFKFEWAADVDGVRDVLYQDGVFDTNVVPGMTLPIDLPALISLRTKNKIDAITAEHADKTKVEFVGDKGNGVKVYRVRFSRLGENMLTIKYGNGLWSTLEFFVTEPLETVIQKRSSFIVTHMQHNDPSKWFYGAYGDWDQKNHILRNAEDRDGLSTWLVDSCDDAGNARPAYIASKNVFFPNQFEIDSVELYIKKFLWGGMQMTTQEKYPYGIYGIPNWYVNRNSQDTGFRGQAHLWRIYDYPHIIMLYYRMYQIAKYYPDMVHYLDAAGYLERACGTAVAYWTVPMQTDQPPWSANSVGTMNEAFLPELIRALENEGRKEQAARVRGLWESKVERFVNKPPNLFGSEFAFDSTGFESTASFAHYALENVLSPGQAAPANLPGDHFQRRVSYENALKFMDFQLRLNMGDRGWLETTYYQLGSDYRGSLSYLLSYMSHLGGWGVLDYGLHFAKDPTKYLRLGYASSLSAWALVNSGTAESGYGYWNPGKENDGATGGGFVPEAWGRGWIGKQMARGAWYYSAEEDVGYCGALRTHATIIANDPIFGEFAYGAELTRKGGTVAVIPRDGLRTRIHVIRGDQRLHMELARDGYAKEQPVTVNDTLTRIQFTLENRAKGAHSTELEISGLPAGNYRVTVDGNAKTFQSKGGEASQMIDLSVRTAEAKVSIERAR